MHATPQNMYAIKMCGSFPTQTLELHYSSEAAFQLSLSLCPRCSHPHHCFKYPSSNSIPVFFHVVPLRTLSPTSVWTSTGLPVWAVWGYITGKRRTVQISACDMCERQYLCLTVEESDSLITYFQSKSIHFHLTGDFMKKLSFDWHAADLTFTLMTTHQYDKISPGMFYWRVKVQ